MHTVAGVIINDVSPLQVPDRTNKMTNKKKTFLIQFLSKFREMKKILVIWEWFKMPTIFRLADVL